MLCRRRSGATAVSRRNAWLPPSHAACTNPTSRAPTNAPTHDRLCRSKRAFQGTTVRSSAECIRVQPREGLVVDGETYAEINGHEASSRSKWRDEPGGVIPAGGINCVVARTFRANLHEIVRKPLKPRRFARLVRRPHAFTAAGRGAEPGREHPPGLIDVRRNVLCGDRPARPGIGSHWQTLGIVAAIVAAAVACASRARHSLSAAVWNFPPRNAFAQDMGDTSPCVVLSGGPLGVVSERTMTGEAGRVSERA